MCRLPGASVLWPASHKRGAAVASDLPFILVVTLPFLGVLLVLAAKVVRYKAVPYVAVAVGVATAVVSILAVPKVHSGECVFGLAVDGLGYFVALTSSALGALVLIYSLGYMAHERDQARYYVLVLLTVGSVNGLSLSGNVLAMVAFWVSCSYLTSQLIGFHRGDPAAVEGSRKALVFARAGDLLLVLGIGLMYFGSGAEGLGLTQIMEGASRANPAVQALSAYAILLSAMIRSAQIPLHVWLPGAMEAPSSASALLDAATVMNAGVYLVMRFYPLFRHVPAWTESVMWIGTATILFSALMAFCATDLKRMLAYSTMSQLGYMFLAVGTGSLLGAQFHMMSHAIFKTLLFLSAGSLLHATGTRDMDSLSGAASRMPTTSRVFLVGVMGLSGVPFMSGFFSKDMILAGALLRREYAALVLAGLGAVLTVAYSWSAYFRVFRGSPSEVVLRAHEAPASMEVPMVLLALLTPLFWLFIGIESSELAYTVPGLGVHSISPSYLVEETFASTAFLISLAALAIGFTIVRSRKRLMAWMDAHAAGLVAACRQGFYFDRLFASPAPKRRERREPMRRV